MGSSRDAILWAIASLLPPFPRTCITALFCYPVATADLHRVAPNSQDPNSVNPLATLTMPTLDSD